MLLQLLSQPLTRVEVGDILGVGRINHPVLKVRDENINHKPSKICLTRLGNGHANLGYSCSFI